MKYTPIFNGVVSKGKLKLSNTDRFNNYLLSLDGEVEVLVRYPKKDRSLNQNRYYFGVVVEIISQRVDNPGKLECSLDELLNIAARHFPQAVIDRGNLAKGLADLRKREWIDWKNKDEKSFRFKLGILPLWMRNYHIIDVDQFVGRN